MNNDRIERFSRIRGWLGYPYAQKPNPHQILSHMLVTEQTLNLRLSVTGKPWNLISKTITTTVGTPSYEIEQPVADYQNSGKVHFVVRATERDELPFLPVPFDDFSEQNYGEMQAGVNSALIVPEKISFYRANIQNQVINAVLQPVPQEALAYTIYFLAGYLDRSQALMNGTGPIMELADLCDMKTAVSLLPYADWSDVPEANAGKRKEIAATLMLQIAELEPLAEKYLSQLNGPKTFSMDHCFGVGR